jgi:MFS family permease
MLSMHIAIVVYFNSIFLQDKGFDVHTLETVYIISSLFAFAIYYILPKLLTRFGLYKVMFFSTILEILTFFSIAFAKDNNIFILVFTASFITSIPLFYGLDILLESETANEKSTGNTRSTLLTTGNIAFLLSPLMAGFIIKYSSFQSLYILSALLIIPILLVLNRQFDNFTDAKYHHFSLMPTFQFLKTKMDIQLIYYIQLLLRVFFSWMVIYIPIHLYTNVGLSLSTTGIMFSIMLLPYVILEYPLGHYVDKWYGEKELLILGFAILSISTYILSFITTQNIFIWTFILLITRIGAAIIEVMSEIYFFKHVDAGDTNIISGFRMLMPISYIIGPLLGLFLLSIIPMQYIFGVLGITLLTGLVASTLIHDTK